MENVFHYFVLRCYPWTVGVASFCSSSSVNNMPPGSDPLEVNEEDKPSKNVIAHISQFADDNLTFVRVSNRFEQCVSFHFNGVEMYWDTAFTDYKLNMPAIHARRNSCFIVLSYYLHILMCFPTEYKHVSWSRWSSHHSKKHQTGKYTNTLDDTLSSLSNVFMLILQFLYFAFERMVIAQPANKNIVKQTGSHAPNAHHWLSLAECCLYCFTDWLTHAGRGILLYFLTVGRALGSHKQ